MQLRWRTILLIWSLPMAIELTQRFLAYFARGETPTLNVLAFTVITWSTWALITPAVFNIVRRYPPRRPGLAKPLAVHGVAALGIGVLYTTWIAIAHYFLIGPVEGMKDATLGAQIAAMLVRTPLSMLLIYTMLAGIAYGLQLNRDLRDREIESARLETHGAELERRLTEAQLTALRAQLQPHFLFNTLHAIAALMDDDPVAARAMLARLSDLLRATLDATGSPSVTLDHEIELLERYLDIERLRLGDRLRVSYDVNDEALTAQVPSLLLQPLVENAVRHGIAPLSRPGHITIRAARSPQEALQILIRDDGAGLDPAVAGNGGPHEGIGLANTRERLAHLESGAGSLELRPGPDGGVEVEIRLPFMEAPST